MSGELTPEQQAVHDRIDELEPLRALVETEAFDAAVEGLRGLRASFIDDSLFAHINGLVTTATNLKAALAAEPTEVPPAPPPAPEPSAP